MSDQMHPETDTVRRDAVSQLTPDEQIELAAARILQKYRKAFEELAK